MRNKKKSLEFASLCWECDNVGHGRCSWDRELKLEPGTEYRTVERRDGIFTIIQKCPKYTTEPIPHEMPTRGVYRLCNSIMATAAKDYRKLWAEYLENKDAGTSDKLVGEIRLIEAFFEGAWADELTKLNTKLLLEELQADIFVEEMNKDEQISNELCEAEKSADLI